MAMFNMSWGIIIGAFVLLGLVIFFLAKAFRKTAKKEEKAEEKGEKSLVKMEKTEMGKLQKAMQGEEFEAKLERIEFSLEQRLYTILSRIFQALNYTFRNPAYKEQVIKSNVNLYKLALETATELEKELDKEKKAAEAELKKQRDIEMLERKELRSEHLIEKEEEIESKMEGRMLAAETKAEEAATKKAEAEIKEEVKLTRLEETEEHKKWMVIVREHSAIRVLTKTFHSMIESLKKGDINKAYPLCANMLNIILTLERMDKYNLSASQRIELGIKKDEQIDQLEEARTIGLAKRIKKKMKFGKKSLF